MSLKEIIEASRRYGADRDFVVKTIMEAARSGKKGAFGDGKIFVSPVDEVFTVSSGVCETATPEEA